METDTQLIKDKIDIVDLISEYVQLKPAGTNQKGLCPFHHEKSPSFMVNRERQSWHCFGCTKGGDIFTFLEEIEGMEFVEALKYLANRAGIQLTNTFENKLATSQKNRLKDINIEAARFYHKFLTQMSVSKVALTYLHDRGITDETIDAWQIGFVPEQWDLLTQYLLKKGKSIDDLVSSGLTIKRENAGPNRGFYDRFRGRIMFPIRDVHGMVVGFTGRVLVETEKSGGKYINSPQSSVYDKSRVVFGLDKAKQTIRKKNLIVMVEGQMDVIACHQAEMTNVVATSGTALTKEQVALLKRYSLNMAVAFDNDSAGIKAGKRGSDLAILQKTVLSYSSLETSFLKSNQKMIVDGMSVKIIQIPEGAGKDPDECIKNNKQVWFNAVENAKDVMQWYMDCAFIGKDIKNPKDKQDIANNILSEIARIPYAVERDHWIQQLSIRLGVDVSILREDSTRISIEQKQKTGKILLKNKEKPLVKENTKSSDHLDLVHKQFLALILRVNKLIQHLQTDTQFQIILSTSHYAPLYDAIKNQYTSTGSLDVTSLVYPSYLDNNGERLVDILLMQSNLLFGSLAIDKAEMEYKAYVERIHDEYIKQRRKELKQKITQAEQAKDHEQLTKLLIEFQKLTG